MHITKREEMAGPDFRKTHIVRGGSINQNKFAGGSVLAPCARSSPDSAWQFSAHGHRATAACARLRMETGSADIICHGTQGLWHRQRRPVTPAVIPGGFLWRAGGVSIRRLP